MVLKSQTQNTLFNKCRSHIRSIAHKAPLKIIIILLIKSIEKNQSQSPMQQKARNVAKNYGRN